MFTVGEFSRLAQVSKRLLRYYDRIGLLKPIHIDRLTGYRYYSTSQLPELNRIRALKDLGLSLEQIQRLLRDKISTEEMQGMLLLKKAEIEQQLQEEMQRIRNIEARLQYLRESEMDRPLDVVIKQIPSQPALSLRTRVESMEAGMDICDQAMGALSTVAGCGPFFAIFHGDIFDESSFDIELGGMVTAKPNLSIVLNNDLQLKFRELPAAPMMATYIVRGWNESILTGYAAIGRWMEVNGYRFAGAPREVTLQLPQMPGGNDSIAEIQFPIESAASGEHSHSSIF